MPDTNTSPSEHESFDESEKRSSHDGSFVKLKSGDDIEMGSTSEREELMGNGASTAAAIPAAEKPADAPGSSARAAVVWMVINTLSTIGIVCDHAQRLRYR